MLTDDDLTRQLGGAFRDATGDLEYAGRVPAPRSPISTVGVPLASTAAVVAALAVVWASSPDTDDATPPSAGTATPSAPSSAPRVVTRTIEVAGFTYRYRGEPRADDLYATLDVAVPDDATPVDPPAGAIAGVKAWVGTDPTSGDHAIWVQSPSRNAGQVFAILSPTWTTDQLVDLFRNGQPRTVPAV
jgi:hypothetical protein